MPEVARAKHKKAAPIIHIHDAYDHTEKLPEWNLICENKHLSFSPEPMTWVGHECGCHIKSKATGRRVTCRKKQMLLKDYKPTRTPKPKPPKKRKRKFVSRY